MTDDLVHVPVLLAETRRYLALRPGAHCIDCTANGGGHTAALLADTAPDGVVLGIDRDPDILTRLHARLGDFVTSGRLLLERANFADLAELIAARHFPPADAILFDLGVSSYHFDASGRGFTIARDEPLDMRSAPTARSASLRASPDPSRPSAGPCHCAARRTS
jgi:16S rRNA (cytosine1402-N4)-methyltransferase